MPRSTRGFVFKLFIFLQEMFQAFNAVFRKQNDLFRLIYISETVLIKLLFFFNFRICICKFSGRLNS